MNYSNTNLLDLIRLSFDGPIIWLAGERLQPVPIQCVTTQLEELAPGDLFLLPASQATHKALEKAAQNNAAAGVVIGSLPPNLELKTIDLPILSLPNYSDLRQVQQRFLSGLLNQRSAALERGLKTYTQLMQITAEGGGQEGVARTMAEICGHAILIQDKRGRILADQTSSALQTIWMDIRDHLRDLDSLPETLKDRKLAGRQAPLTTQEIPGGIERLIKPIIVSQVARGYISVVAAAGELDTLDQVVLEQGSLVGAIEMSRHKAVREAEKRLKGDLLTALLQNDIAPRDAQLWAQSMEVDLSQAHVAMRISWGSSDAPSRRRLETLVNGEALRLGEKVIVTLMASEVTCFCQAPAGPQAALLLGQAILDQGRNEYSEIQIHCGIGNPAQDISEWRDSFRQAGQAMEMSRRLGESKPLYFRDLSVYRLLLQIEHNPEMTAFQEETIGPLLDYDGGYDLISTLEAYFDHTGNLSQTAEALFIHRNTLLYRMERIKEILNLDLDNPTSRLAVQLALYIYRLLGRKTKSV